MKNIILGILLLFIVVFISGCGDTTPSSSYPSSNSGNTRTNDRETGDELRMKQRNCELFSDENYNCWYSQSKQDCDCYRK